MYNTQTHHAKQPPEVKAACAAAAAHCSSVGVDISALALKFALSSDVAASTLVGMASVDVVRANVEAALRATAEGGGGGDGGGSGDGSGSGKGGGGGDDGDGGEAAAREWRALEEVRRILAPVQRVTWPSGRPENSSLPAT